MKKVKSKDTKKAEKEQVLQAEAATCDKQAADKCCSEDTACAEELPADSQDLRQALQEAEAQVAALIAEKEDLQSTVRNLQEQDLRLRAEYDNFRRRTQQEKERIYGDAMQAISKEILPLFDNLVRAKDTADQQAAQVKGEAVENVVVSLQKGNELVLQQAQGIFTKLGISAISPLGEQFNPEEHAAVMHIEDDSYGENEVVEVFETGYKYGERVLRPAMVKVAN